MLDGVTQGISDVISSIKTSINSVITAIGNLVGDLVSAFGDLLKSLFVPSDDFFKDKVDSLLSEFSFVESVVGTISVIADFIENTDFSQPPKLTISLDLNKSKIDYGSSAVAIDFSWYKDYKPTVDIVLSAILYINFAWAVFKDLPNIISGVAGGASSYSSLENEVGDRVMTELNNSFK